MEINVGEMLCNRAYISPDMEAFVCSDYRFNFRQVNERSNQFASFLKKSQIKHGDCVAVLCKNNEHAMTVMFGAAKIGVITLMLNWRLQPPELIYIMNDCGASLLLYDGEFGEVVNKLRDQVTVKYFLRVGGDGMDAEFEESIADQNSVEPAYKSHGDDPAVLMYTSGTTGKPKGVMLTHHNLFWASIGLTHTIDWGYRYRFLSVAPLFHIGGLAPIFGNVHSGCATVFMPNFDPVKIWDTIEREKINYAMTVPAMLQFMLFAPDIQKKDLSSIKHIVCGGSPVSQDLIRTYDKMGIRVEQVYGITEYTGAVAFWTPEMGMENSNSTGKTVFHGHVKIFRPGTFEELPQGEVGEICCFGPQVFKGYWNNPDATAAVIKDGYYRSGDMGKVDKEGFLYVVDRLKDMIISGSENVYPAELEQVISAHPGVAEVAVVGKPDAKWGEIPVALIVVRPGMKVVGEEIISLCRENLAKYKCVKEVRFINTIPKNAVGKVLKKELRSQLV
jgi:O-succinylbenzoate-CoA ligase